MVPVIIAMIWAAAETWRDLFDRRHPPYVALKKAAAELETGDAQTALRMFKRAASLSTRHRDLAALGAAWRGIAASRMALGDEQGADAADDTASDAEHQISKH